MNEPREQLMINLIKKILKDAGHPEAGRRVTQPSFRVSLSPRGTGRIEVKAIFPASYPVTPRIISTQHQAYGQAILAAMAKAWSDDDLADSFVSAGRWGEIETTHIAVIIPANRELKQLRRSVGLR